MTSALPAKVQTALERARLRATRARVAVLEEMMASASPLTTSELITRVTRHGVGSSTVYTALSSLESARVIERLDFGEDRSRYEIAEELIGVHHHHFVCRVCGRIDDVGEETRVERSLDWLARSMEESGRTVESHRLDLVGVCETCTAQK